MHGMVLKAITRQLKTRSVATECVFYPGEKVLVQDFLTGAGSLAACSGGGESWYHAHGEREKGGEVETAFRPNKAQSLWNQDK